MKQRRLVEVVSVNGREADARMDATVEGAQTAPAVVCCEHSSRMVELALDGRAIDRSMMMCVERQRQQWQECDLQCNATRIQSACTTRVTRIACALAHDAIRIALCCTCV